MSARPAMVPAPLPSSHPADLAERLLGDLGAERLAAMDRLERTRAVHRLAGLPLRRGGLLHLSARHVARTLRAVRRALAATVNDDTTGAMSAPSTERRS